MAEERLSYTIPADATGDNGSQVDLILTYDPNSVDANGYVTVTSASGSYQTIDSNGAVIDSDTVTGVAQAGNSFGTPDNKLFIGSDSPFVTSNGITYNISNASDSNNGAGAVNFSTPDGKNFFEDGSNGTPASTVSEAAVACFASGTLIRTIAGDVAVEYLRVGDVVVTSSGAHQPIRWLGHRTIDIRRHPRPLEAMPVRVSAHAFETDRPARDLLVSPGHSLCLDVVGEVLIPAASLINGSTIVQELVDTITYWHVELDAQDILLAENMPAESYLEMGNRGFFAESGTVGIDAAPDASIASCCDFCRPFFNEGALVEVVRAQLGARAERLGWQLEPQGLGNLHLLVDGLRIEPCISGLSVSFALPAGAAVVWLVSGSSVPASFDANSTDRRFLGVPIVAINLDDGSGMSRAVALDDQRIRVGFHDVEWDGGVPWRWTTGRARLPASLWEELSCDVYLRIDLASPPLPRWVAPEQGRGPIKRFASK